VFFRVSGCAVDRIWNHLPSAEVKVVEMMPPACPGETHVRDYLFAEHNCEEASGLPAGVSRLLLLVQSVGLWSSSDREPPLGKPAASQSVVPPSSVAIIVSLRWASRGHHFDYFLSFCRVWDSFSTFDTVSAVWGIFSPFDTVSAVGGFSNCITTTRCGRWDLIRSSAIV
jgi:hypothetical protein